MMHPDDEADAMDAAATVADRLQRATQMDPLLEQRLPSGVLAALWDYRAMIGATT